MPLIPLGPGVQEAVSGAFAQPQKGQSFGDVFDTLLALREQERKRVSETFEALTRGNPALAQFLVASQPGLFADLTKPTGLRGPSPAKAATAKIEAGTREFTALQAKPGRLELTGQQQSQLAQDAITELSDEALRNDKALNAYLEARMTDDPKVVERNISALAQAGSLRRKPTGAGTLEIIDQILTHKEQFVDAQGNPLIRPGTEFADAYRISRQPQVDELLRRERELRIQDLLAKDLLTEDDVTNALNEIADARRAITAAEARKKEAQESSAAIQELVATAGVAPEQAQAMLEGMLPPGSQAAAAGLVAAADAEIAARNDEIKALQAKIASGRKGPRKPGEAAPTRRKSLAELLEEARKPAAP